MSKRIIPDVPNTGRHNSCHINSCHMLLQYRGVNIPLPKFNPSSSFSFGFLYVNDGKFILPAMSGCPCRDCMAFITGQLGYDYEIVSGENFKIIWTKIKEFIDNDMPLAAGPLPMELYQENNPQAPQVGLDSFCVVCGYDEDEGLVFLTDTFGLGYVPVSVDKFEAGWKKGKRLCPNELIPETPFLFVLTEKVKTYDEVTVVKNTLRRAYELIKGKKLSESLYLGIEGQRQFSEDLKRHFDLDTKNLPVIASTIKDFTFLIGAQSRGDIVYFLHDYAYKLPENTEKSKILKLASIYEEELGLFMEGLRRCSQALKGKEGSAEIDPLFSVINRQVNKIIGLEEEVMNILKTF